MLTALLKTIAIFAVFFVFWKVYKKTKFVTVMSMDFETGRRELDEVSPATSDPFALLNYAPL